MHRATKKLSPNERPRQYTSSISSTAWFVACAGGGVYRVGAKLFDEMNTDGRMPKPKQVNNRRLWDCISLDESFAALPGNQNINPWDEAAP